MKTRRRSVRLLSQLNADADAARRTFQAESDRRGEEQERVAEANEAARLADLEAAASAVALVEAYREWCAAAAVLAPAAAARVRPDIPRGGGADTEAARPRAPAV